MHAMERHPVFVHIPGANEYLYSEASIMQLRAHFARSEYPAVVLKLARAVVATGMDRPIARYRRNIIVAVLIVAVLIVAILLSDAEPEEQWGFIKLPIARVEFQAKSH